MTAPKVLNLPTEVQLALEVMPCQAMHRVYESAATPHACAYFAEWGSYHSFDYASEGPPETPGIEQRVVYTGKTALIPEILSGCRKAPIMSVGINPNLPGWWPLSRNAVNPLFEDFLQYAHYFRYRSVAKLQIPKAKYNALLAGRNDRPASAEPLVEESTPIPVELANMKMYTSYQSLLDGLGAKMGWAGHQLSVGEDLSYANMVACPSAKWVIRRDANNPEMPVMGQDRLRGIVRECFHERKYFLRQLFQSLPSVLLVFSESTSREFITAMRGKFVKGEPQPGEPLADLLQREIRLGYGTAPDGDPLTARVVFLPHASANPEEFERFKGPVIDILAQEVAAGRLAYNPATRHLGRPRGGCVFCSNELYRIGPCDYKEELRPLAAADTPVLALAGSDEMEAVGRENVAQAGLLDAFLGAPTSPPAGPGPVAGLEPALSDEPQLLDVDDPVSPEMVLRGRIVTMNDQGDVIDDGALYLRHGAIVAVARRADPPPAGFNGAPVLETHGTIYPGLLDLHNHLAYNILTLWQPPRAFANRDQWQRHAGYRENVSLPMGVLASDRATIRAIVRYVEVKALLGGTTSAQGMVSRFRKTIPFYTGAVRNFENTDDGRLPESTSRVRNLNPASADDVLDFRSKLQGRLAYFYHLAEGIDPPTRQHYVNLEQHDLLHRSLVAIHCLALDAPDLSNLSGRGCKVVWSPLSNLLLYGRTIDTRRLQGLPFTIGCDWTPSGSKNLLEELKVAWLSVKKDGGQVALRDLCAAVTRQAASAVSWAGALGTIENGKYADLLVTTTLVADPYENLLRATERDVLLVVIAGCPRYGDAELMAAYPPSLGKRELLTVGGKPKSLYLQHPRSLLNDLGFAAAQAKLQESTSRLRELEAELAAAPFSLSAEADDVALLLDNDDYPPGAPGEPDFLSSVVLPASVPLDPPTVVDDPQHFDRLEAIGHLPPLLRELRAFYQST